MGVFGSTRNTKKSKSQDEFPKRQLCVLGMSIDSKPRNKSTAYLLNTSALCRICEPIAFMSVFPYVYYMVQSFNITEDDRQISFYAGMVTSSFALAEFSTSMLWGKLSDKIGRKPVLILGLFGTMISMLVFGFATSLPAALLGRALGGLLNGNIGVLQTTVAEIVTVKEHQPRAYSLMPFVWCLGSILGPALGGALAQPSKNYPSIFASGSFLARYPFALPNLVCAGILIVGMLIGILFLEETHGQKKRRRDLGLEIGNWILRCLSLTDLSDDTDEKCAINLWEQFSLLEDDPPSYRTSEDTPQIQSRSQSLSARKFDHLGDSIETRSIGVEKAFTRNVVINIIGFGVLAL